MPPKSSFSKRAGRGQRAESTMAKRLAALHVTLSGAVLVILAVVGWVLAHHVGSKAAYLLVYAAVLAMGVSWFAARRRLKLQVERSQLPTRMREGQSNAVTLTLRSGRRLSALLLREELHPALGPDVLVPVVSVGPGDDVEHRYAFTPARRGVYRVGPLSAIWTDPFGLTTHEQQLLEPVEVIVHPSTRNVDDRILARMWEDPPVRPPVSKPWPTGFEFYGMRDYVPGDDLRRVVWTAVAKTGRMLVRESEQGITDRVSVVLDTDRDAHSRGEPSETFEWSVKIAAAVIAKHVDDGFSVSLMTNEGRLARSLRGSKAKTQLLDHLSRLGRSQAPLRRVGEDMLADARTGAHFVIVTPHLDKETTNRLRIALEHGASVTIAKIVWEETDPLSLARAAGLGCRVVQVPVGGSITGAFTHQVGGGLRR